jgi:hypothetical protein
MANHIDPNVNVTSIMEKSKTMVAKSIDASACLAPTTRKATISTPPKMAAPGRSIHAGKFADSKHEVAAAETR